MADFKPNDLLVGIVDFFAVLLPGAVLTFVLQHMEAFSLNDRINDLLKYRSNEAKWVIFAISSYLLGHFTFLIGAKYFDDLYDTTYVKHLGSKRSWQLVKFVGQMRQVELEGTASIVNNFKWVRAYIKLNKPEAAAEIDRLEADSKFFRGMIVVTMLGWLFTGLTGAREPWFLAFVLILHWVLQNRRPRRKKKQARKKPGQSPKNPLLQTPDQLAADLADLKNRYHWLRLLGCFRKVATKLQWVPILAIGLELLIFRRDWIPNVICFLMICLSAWRYADQRWKMTQTAYLYFVLLNQPAKAPEPELVPLATERIKSLLQDIFGGKN